MQWLAAAYKQPDDAAQLPAPSPERLLWPWHLQPHMQPAGNDHWPATQVSSLSATPDVPLLVKKSRLQV